MMLFVFLETFYSESEVKQVDVSSMVLGFGILPSHVPALLLAMLQQCPPAMHDDDGAHRYIHLVSTSKL